MQTVEAGSMPTPSLLAGSSTDGLCSDGVVFAVCMQHTEPLLSQHEQAFEMATAPEKEPATGIMQFTGRMPAIPIASIAVIVDSHFIRTA
ncbi:MAG: hypothetical protein ABIP97_11325 [Chthoniobacterales bacterium]